ncbi:hypothetical protein [Desulfothermobacter acidiphilus]|uniref:hypothetical protein n=1 Tax=Desulfothermobacter acidiphilus TaxID=1938353 RepID=UPI003F8A1E96
MALFMIYAAIYKTNPLLGEQLHERGFAVGGHRYKLFTFSLLFPQRARRREEGLEMVPPILQREQPFWARPGLYSVIQHLAQENTANEGRRLFFAVYAGKC